MSDDADDLLFGTEVDEIRSKNGAAHGFIPHATVLLSTNYDLEAHVAKVFEAMHMHNNPPRIFVHDDEIKRVSDRAPYKLVALGPAHMRSEIVAAGVVFLTKSEKRVDVPKPIIEECIVTRDAPFPAIDGFAYAPFFIHGKNAPILCATPGYHAASRRYLVPNEISTYLGDHPLPTDLETLEVDVSVAKGKLRSFVHDFPFADDASFANCVAYMLQDFVRPLIAGATPLYYFRAPTSQTGKSLLAKVTAFISTGSMPHGIMPIKNNVVDDAELGKSIVGLLATSAPFIMYDNVSGKIKSAVLESLLTSQLFTHRMLGVNSTPTYPVTQRVAITGNNASLSTDLTNRTVLITIDAHLEDPTQRTFSKPDIEAYAIKNRPRLARSLLLLIANWIALGMPLSDVRFGPYPQYARIMGGILSAAAIDGFLSNSDKLRAAVDEDTHEQAEFFNACYGKFGSMPAPASDPEFIAIAIANGIIDDRRSNPAMSLGAKLRGMADRVFDGITLTKVSVGQGGRTYSWKFTIEETTPHQVPQVPQVP